ncbi:MAG: hypothetical protein K0S20_28 [Patescibacteria group bacterium]|jgi:hypothetical protein|nr:hypothetical protein [Patescibacteria group bacterium]
MKRRPEVSTVANRLWLPGLMAVFSIAFLVLYSHSYAYFGYPSAPGGDLYNHFLHIRELQNGGIAHFYEGYPKFFHLLVLAGMSLTGLDPLKVMLYMVPLVLLGSALASSWLAYRLGGKVAAFTAFMLMLFVSGQPLQTLYDGGFPNTIAAHIIAPFFLGFVALYLQAKYRKWLLAAFFTGFLLVSTHAFTAVYIGLTIVSLIFLYKKIFWKYGLPFMILCLLFLLTPVAQPLRSILASVIRLKSDFPWVAVVGKLDNPNAIWRLVDYPEGINYFIVYAGIIGTALLAYQAYQKKEKAPLSYMVFVWIILLFVGSRLEVLGFPVRLARDLATPLTIAASIVVATVWERPRFRIPLRIALIALIILMTNHHFLYRLQRIRHYEPTMQYTNADQEAVDMIGDRPAAAIAQFLPYVAKANVVPVFLSENGIHTPEDRAQLESKEYVFFEIRSGHNGEVFRPLVEEMGFRQVAVFKDPLKSVILFRR